MRKERPLIYSMARNAAGIAAAFLLLLTALVVSEQRRNRALLLEADTVLITLREQVKGLPDDAAALKTVRDLDYLYRDGYFSNERRLRLGVVLGSIALLVLVVSAGTMTLTAPVALKRPADNSKERSQQLRRLQMATAVSVALLLGLGGLAWWAARRQAVASADAAPTPGEVGGNGGAPTTSASSVPAPLALPAALAESARQWPAFRGSLLPNENRLPPHFRLQCVWTSKLPLPGYNSPLVWDERVFVSGANRRERAYSALALPMAPCCGVLTPGRRRSYRMLAATQVTRRRPWQLMASAPTQYSPRGRFFAQTTMAWCSGSVACLSRSCSTAMRHRSCWPART